MVCKAEILQLRLNSLQQKQVISKNENVPTEVRNLRQVSTDTLARTRDRQHSIWNRSQLDQCVFDTSFEIEPTKDNKVMELAYRFMWLVYTTNMY